MKYNIDEILVTNLNFKDGWYSRQVGCLTKVDKGLDILGPRMLQEGGGAVESDFFAVVDVEDNVVLNGVIDEVANHLSREQISKQIGHLAEGKDEYKFSLLHQRSQAVSTGKTGRQYFTSKQTATPMPSSVAP